MGSSLNDRWNVVCTDATQSTLKIYNILLQLTMLLSTAVEMSCNTLTSTLIRQFKNSLFILEICIHTHKGLLSGLDALVNIHKHCGIITTL